MGGNVLNDEGEDVKRYVIGIDNGVSGSVGILDVAGSWSHFFPMPVHLVQDYTKKKKNINRINVKRLRWHLKGCHQPDDPAHPTTARAMLEAPLVNPGKFNATVSAMRALEATLIVLENLKIPYEFVISKEWQSYLLPRGTKGAPDLKKASMDIGVRLFPSCKEAILKQKDADGLLIAEHCRRVR